MLLAEEGSIPICFFGPHNMNSLPHFMTLIAIGAMTAPASISIVVHRDDCKRERRFIYAFVPVHLLATVLVDARDELAQLAY